MISDIASVRVNHIEISADQISSEMQYHPAASRREAMVSAAQALILNELVRQKAIDFDLLSAHDVLPFGQEEDMIMTLIDRDAHVPHASSQECHHFYQNHREQFSTAPLLEIKHILIAAAKDDIEGRIKASQEAETLINFLLENTYSFAELAARYSDCPSAKQGGNLGQISKGQTAPEFEKQVFSAEVGLLAAPVETRYGYHIVEISRRVDGAPLPYQAVEADIRHYLDTKVTRKTIAQYLNYLIGEADIQGFDFDMAPSPLMQ